MQTLSKKEWIVIVISLVIIIILMGGRFLTKDPADQLKKIQVEEKQNSLATTTATTTAKIATTTSNNQNKNMDTQNSGLIIKDVVIGTGVEAKDGNLVSVQYTGKFADGKVFDSSIPRGKPIQFTLGVGQVIPGWDQGILGMKVGGKRTLTIPPALGYGVNGYPPVIPGNSTLYFDVELVGVQAQ